jgi:hypothetical protein
MKLIVLTSYANKKHIYININEIGHFYEVEETISHNVVQKRSHTKIGVTTHNNGGFEVVETPSQIIKLIKEIKN